MHRQNTQTEHDVAGAALTAGLQTNNNAAPPLYGTQCKWCRCGCRSLQQWHPSEGGVIIRVQLPRASTVVKIDHLPQ
jgi:hypothetical protein